MERYIFVGGKVKVIGEQLLANSWFRGDMQSVKINIMTSFGSMSQTVFDMQSIKKKITDPRFSQYEVDKHDKFVIQFNEIYL